MILRGRFRGLSALAATALLTLACSSLNDSAVPDRAVPEPRGEAVLDCPLRDAPFSLDLPLMDILLSEQATAVVNRAMGDMLTQLPPTFASTEPPSFSAIITLVQLAAMGGLPASALEPVGDELARLPVTDRDRAARCARYDNERPTQVPTGDGLKVLVFQKMTGFRDGPSVDAAEQLLRDLAQEEDWSLVVTELGGAMTPDYLALFDTVIWNNVSGDVLTLTQRAAFKDYILGGGGYVGIHGSGGDYIYDWDWYVDELVGARFIGHPSDPQFQWAVLHTQRNATGIGAGLPPQWTLTEEWYSFRESPRNRGAEVIVTIDETSYSPVGRGGHNVRMGQDHPLVWARKPGAGRAFYSALGHRPEVYQDANHIALLRQGIAWTAGAKSE